MRRLFKTITGGAASNEPDIPEPPLPPSPGQPAPIAVHKLNFPALGFPEYKGEFALVIDNLFTQADCDKLLNAAEAAHEWEVAQVNGRGGSGYTDLSYRHSSRILYDDFELADWILEKLRPYMREIEEADPGRHYIHSKPSRTRTQQQRDHNPPVQLSRLNERLRFLKYGPEQFFRRHCDGCYFTPDKTEVSYYTLQLYLNGDSESLKGGATRFTHHRPRKDGGREYIDVDPRMGRVLIFEQARLLHSGEEVESGEKITIRTELMYRDPQKSKDEK